MTDIKLQVTSDEGMVRRIPLHPVAAEMIRKAFVEHLGGDRLAAVLELVHLLEASVVDEEAVLDHVRKSDLAPLEDIIIDNYQWHRDHE